MAKSVWRPRLDASRLCGVADRGGVARLRPSVRRLVRKAVCPSCRGFHLDLHGGERREGGIKFPIPLEDCPRFRSDQNCAGLSAPLRLVLHGAVYPGRPRVVDVCPRHEADFARAHSREALDACHVREVSRQEFERRVHVCVRDGLHRICLVRLGAEWRKRLHLRKFRLARCRDIAFVECPGPHVADALDVAVHGVAAEAAADERVADGEHVGVLQFGGGALSEHFAQGAQGALADARLARWRAVVSAVVCRAVLNVQTADRVHGKGLDVCGRDAARGGFPDFPCGGNGHVARPVSVQGYVTAGSAEFARLALLLAGKTDGVPPVAVVDVDSSFHLVFLSFRLTKVL